MSSRQVNQSTKAKRKPTPGEEKIDVMQVKRAKPSATPARKKHTKDVSFQDVIYGSISFSPLLLKAIDTVYFQRLSRLLQLGLCHYVYSGATHTRKSHCLGASHLAGVWMRHLQKAQPELHITPRMVELVQLAGLLHDVGHTFYSHMFDHGVAPFLDIPRKDHEERSIHLLKIIAKENDLGLTATEVDMIGHMISGNPPQDRSPAWPDYLFQIVASHIDVDKMDYLKRDSYYTGVPCGFQADRLIQSSRVIDGQLCFSKKVARNILQLFHTRYYMHSEVYQHKATMIVTAMMTDAVKLAMDKLGLEKIYSHDTAWCDLDDFSIRDRMLMCKEAKESHEILRRIDSREWYPKKVIEYNKLAGVTPKKKEVWNGDNAEWDGSVSNTVGYTNENVNPLTKLWFFDGKSPNKRFQLDTDHDLWAVMPLHFAEKRVVYFKRQGIDVPGHLN